MSARAAMDPFSRPGGALSETERKMQILMQNVDSGGSDEDELGPAPRPIAPLLATLPIELIDRILDHAVEPLPSAHLAEVAATTTTATATDAFSSAVGRSEAYRLCLVCRLFEQLARPKLYRQAVVSVRNMRSFLATVQQHSTLVSLMRSLTLDSRIWTDVDENVIAAILVAVRRSCVRVKVGANESPLLPYLLHGDPDDGGGGRKPDTCSVTVLEVCWRDDVQVLSDEQQQRGESSRHDTLRQLLVHAAPALPLALYIQHLTLDLVSLGQLHQVFDSEGYFVQAILPGLTFVRLEMPLAVLQFQCATPGGLIDGWPREDWAVQGYNMQGVIEDRLEQLRRMVGVGDGADMLAQTGTEEDAALLMPPCPRDQVKALTVRFLLNVHRNDMTLFKLLVPPRALEQSWSTRASITAHCLSHTLQRHLNRSDQPALLSFPLGDYRRRGAEAYWKDQWAEAQADSLASLPIDIRPPGTGPVQAHMNEQAKVSLLLKWPHAVDAFFHYSAMI